MRTNVPFEASFPPAQNDRKDHSQIDVRNDLRDIHEEKPRPLQLVRWWYATHVVVPTENEGNSVKSLELILKECVRKRLDAEHRRPTCVR